MKRILDDCQGSSVSFVNCVESFTPRLLFQHAIDGFCGHEPNYNNSYTSYQRIDTVQQFIRAIRESGIGDKQPAFLVKEILYSLALTLIKNGRCWIEENV